MIRWRKKDTRKSQSLRTKSSLDLYGILNRENAPLRRPKSGDLGVAGETRLTFKARDERTFGQTSLGRNSFIKYHLLLSIRSRIVISTKTR